MRKFVLALGAASLAIAVPSLAQPEGRGNGNGNAERGNGPGNGNGNGRGQNRERVEERADRQRDRAEDRRDRLRDRREEARDRIRDRREEARDRIEDRFDRDLDRRGNGRRDGRDLGDLVDDVLDFRYGDVRSPRYASSCPPGLAKKGNGCLPPGQARQIYGQRVPVDYRDRRLVGPYADWYGRDDDFAYRLGSEFIYRIGGDGLVSGLIPFYDRRGYYYPVGSRYPDAYDTYNLPYQYRGYYRDDFYRYGDGAIYRVDPETQLIRSVAALLTGDVAVGQRLPSSYSVYNVPYGYRDRYRDRDDAYYRYSDGYIYRVEPETLLVAEIGDAII